MAEYKVLLTVKDRYGNTKEIDGGLINVDLATLTSDEINQIEEKLPLEDYLKKAEIDQELDYYATDKEVTHEVSNIDTIKYSSFFDNKDSGGN
jgi:hypothetical protein